MLRTLYLIFTLVIFLPAGAVVMAENKADEATDTTIILVWGDSLSAAYGIPTEQGWASLLQDKLGDRYQVINGSISGESTAGGLTRLPDALERHEPGYVLIALGANDGLRGIGLEVMRANLEQMITLSRDAGAQVVLAGVALPPNFGPVFTEKFGAVYAALAEAYELPLVPRLLQGVSENWDLMQADGLHPKAEAQPQVLENVWAVFEKILPSSKTHKTGEDEKEEG